MSMFLKLLIGETAKKKKNTKSNNAYVIALYIHPEAETAKNGKKISTTKYSRFRASLEGFNP